MHYHQVKENRGNAISVEFTFIWNCRLDSYWQSLIHLSRITPTILHHREGMSYSRMTWASRSSWTISNAWRFSKLWWFHNAQRFCKFCTAWDFFYRVLSSPAGCHILALRSWHAVVALCTQYIVLVIDRFLIQEQPLNILKIGYHLFIVL